MRGCGGISFLFFSSLLSSVLVSPTSILSPVPHTYDRQLAYARRQLISNEADSAT